MASYNELLALIDAYINRNGVQAITGQILNGVLKAMVDQLGRGYTLMGYAEPTGDPGTPDGPESWFASVPGTYTNYGEIQVAAGELALLSFVPSEGWTKNTIYEGFREVTATADDNIGFPQVGVTYANGVLSFDFKNIKGEPGENGQDGDPAGFGAVTASVDDQVGTPSVSVSSSGPDTAKVFSFAFHNLKGETGVTSVVATVDNTSGNPQCSVSLQGGQLTLAFTGLKGAQGDTGSSVDYPFTIVNNLTTNDPAQALSAAMGVQLESEVSQLEAVVDVVGSSAGTPGLIELSAYTQEAKVIDSSQKWVTPSVPNCFSKIVPITPGTYTITASSTTQSIIAFLSALPTDNATAPFGTVNGVQGNSRISISANNSATYTIRPTDTSIYLCVRDDVAVVLKPTINYDPLVTLNVPLNTEFEQVVERVDDVENMLKYDALKIASAHLGYAVYWSNGAYTTASTCTTYVVKNDGFIRVNGTLGGGNNTFAAVAFYTTDGISADGFMPSESVRMPYSSSFPINVPVPVGCKTIAIINRDSENPTPSVSLSVSNIADRITNGVGEYEYSGKIQVIRNSFNLIVRVYTSIAPDLGSRQGMDIYNGIMFLGRDGGDIEAIQLSDMSVIDTFEAACASENAHMNCINFGGQVADGSTFPLAYIPAGGVGSAASMQCSVEKFVEAGGTFTATQVQTITLDTSGFAEAGLLPPWDVPTWLIDKERGYLWTFGSKYRTRPGDASILENVYVAHQFNIPDTSEANVVLTASDVLRECRFPFNIFVTQGGTMMDGKIYYLFGYGSETSPSIMQVYDTDDCGISARVLLNGLGQGEAEDASIYDGKVYVSGSSDRILQITFL